MTYWVPEKDFDDLSIVTVYNDCEGPCNLMWRIPEEGKTFSKTNWRIQSGDLRFQENSILLVNQTFSRGFELGVEHEVCVESLHPNTYDPLCKRQTSPSVAGESMSINVSYIMDEDIDEEGKEVVPTNLSDMPFFAKRTYDDRLPLSSRMSGYNSSALEQKYTNSTEFAHRRRSYSRIFGRRVERPRKVVDDGIKIVKQWGLPVRKDIRLYRTHGENGEALLLSWILFMLAFISCQKIRSFQKSMRGLQMPLMF